MMTVMRTASQFQPAKPAKLPQREHNSRLRLRNSFVLRLEAWFQRIEYRSVTSCASFKGKKKITGGEGEKTLRNSSRRDDCSPYSNLDWNWETIAK